VLEFLNRLSFLGWTCIIMLSYYDPTLSSIIPRPGAPREECVSPTRNSAASVPSLPPSRTCHQPNVLRRIIFTLFSTLIFFGGSFNLQGNFLATEYESSWPDGLPVTATSIDLDGALNAVRPLSHQSRSWSC